MSNTTNRYYGIGAETHFFDLNIHCSATTYDESLTFGCSSAQRHWWRVSSPLLLVAAVLEIVLRSIGKWIDWMRLCILGMRFCRISMWFIVQSPLIELPIVDDYNWSWQGCTSTYIEMRIVTQCWEKQSTPMKSLLLQTVCSALHVFNVCIMFPPS